MMTITISMPITNDAKKSFPLQNDAAADDEEDDFPDIFSLKILYVHSSLSYSVGNNFRPSRFFEQ